MKLFNFVPNVQTETEHVISLTQNRTEQLVLLGQLEKEKEKRRKREGNEKETKRTRDEAFQSQLFQRR